MREIEFRGRNKDIGWVYGQLVFDINGNPYIVKEVEQDSSYGLEETMLYVTMWYRVDPETVGQYTGLKDKNGVKIYEKDILAYKDWIGKTIINGVIQYGKFNCSCCGGVYGWYVEGGDIRLCKEDEFIKIEVIGNIYDNPELLEGEKDNE